MRRNQPHRDGGGGVWKEQAGARTPGMESGFHPKYNGNPLESKQKGDMM